MADGAEVITLDSDDEADSSNHIPDQNRSTSGGMVYDPANYADLMAQVAQARLPAPAVKAISEKQIKTKTFSPVSRKFPKRPGVFPPFALFTQEHREKLMQENKELSFADVGRTLGEMWHKLSDSEKEDYRARAKELTEKKLKAWQDQVKKLTPQQQQQIHSQGHSSQSGGGMGVVKRRRTHGYAIFSSEMRKKMGDAIPLSETTRVIAEKWRNADGPTRQEYERRAAKVNEQEAKRYQALLLQNQRRQQAMQLQQQQLQRQRMQIAGKQGSSNGTSHRSQVGSSGLRISSVSSLQKSSSRKSTPNVNLPSSISISRVEPDPDDIRQRLPAGTSMITSSTSQPNNRGGIRPMPKLKRGMRGGVNSRNSSYSAWQQQLLANPLRDNQLKALQDHQQGNTNTFMGTVIPGMKRPSNPSNGMRKRFRGGMTQGPSMAKPARLCRVCCQSSVANFKLADRPDLIRALEFIIDLKIDIAIDKELGKPSVICRKCCTVIITFDQFKRSVQEGQRKLEDIVERRRIRDKKRREEEEKGDHSDDPELIEVSPTVMFTSSPSGEESISPMITTSDTNDVGQDDNDTDELLPNLECEVEINEDPDDEPQPISVKSERIDDIKAKSGEGAKNTLESQDKTNSSPISSPITEKEKDKLACDLAEFETDVIGEQLDRKTSDMNNLSSEETKSPKKSINEETRSDKAKGDENSETNCNGTESRTPETTMQEEFEPEHIEITSNNGDQSNAEEDENQEVEEVADPEIDLSLLHDEEAVEESERSNDDAEAIKLLNDDDEAFESFLDGDDTSNDIPHTDSGNDTETNDPRNSELQQSLPDGRQDDLGNEDLFEANEENETDNMLVENEAFFENEEEEIDDEMEGDED